MQKGLGWSWRPWPRLTWNSRNISLSFLDICSQPYHGLWLRQACVLMQRLDLGMQMCPEVGGGTGCT